MAGNVCCLFLGFFDINKAKRRELLAALKNAFKNSTNAQFEVIDRPLIQMLELRDEVEKEKLKAKWERAQCEEK